jgi:Zn-dependent protease
VHHGVVTDQPLPPPVDPLRVPEQAGYPGYQGYGPVDPTPYPGAAPVAGPPSVGTRLKRATAPLVGAALAVAKFGAVLVKFKAFVVVGSMAVSIAAYASLWGWKYAVGFVLLILVHEMGHVIVLRARGIKASAPVFLPFLGAFVSMKSAPRSVYEEAESALAGPLLGTAGALALAWVAHAEGSDLLRSLAFTGLLINLFNLLPALPLDGGRVAGALHPAIWVVGLLALLGLEIYRPSPILLLVLLLGGYELWHRWRGRNTEASRAYLDLTSQQRMRVGTAYVGLVVVLLIAAHATYIPRTLN